MAEKITEGKLEQEEDPITLRTLKKNKKTTTN